MPSDVQMCNMALARTRAQPIAALNEGSTESIACSTFYEISRDAALRDHAWNFATRRRTLADDLPLLRQTGSKERASRCVIESKQPASIKKSLVFTGDFVLLFCLCYNVVVRLRERK